MNDRPLFAPGVKPPPGSPIWHAFLLAGAAFALWILGVVLFWRPLASLQAFAPVVAAAATAAFLVGLAGWYWVTVRRITGTWKRAWSLPDTASVTANADPAHALRRLLTLAKGTFTWLPFTSGDSTVTLVGSSWRSEGSVRVDAIATERGTQLDLQVVPGTHGSNLVGRVIIARLLQEISDKTDWTRL